MFSGYEDKIPKSELDILKSIHQPYCKIEKGHVVELRLCNEKFTSFPENVLSLKSLKELYFDIGKLSSIPESIGKLKKLKILNIHCNRLEKIPETLGNLTRLTELYFSGNRLISLPDNIGNLKLLRILNLDSNQLTEFPESFEDLHKLRKLNLNNNRFTSVPKCLKDLKSLKKLKMANNPLKTLSYLSLNVLNALKPNINKENLTQKGKKLFLEIYRQIESIDGTLIQFKRKKTLLEYYHKSPHRLTLDYISISVSLTSDEKERLIHEAGNKEFEILENFLPAGDFLLIKIIKSNSLELSNGLKILL